MDIDFLVDSGSGSTTLSPYDGAEMGVHYDSLNMHSAAIVGIGGLSEAYIERANLLFTASDKTVYIYRIGLLILKPKTHLEEIPSLLGRDILHRMQIHYSYPTNTLTFQVETADRIIPIPR